MGEIQRLIGVLIDCGILDNAERKVVGIARQARDKGFDSLSIDQKRVLEPFMARGCDGVLDPADEHNDCNQILTGEELANALEQEGYYDAVLCTHCMGLHEEYQNLGN